MENFKIQIPKNDYLFSLLPSLDLNLKEKTLSNGLKIVFKKTEDSSVCICQTWYKVGSSYEEKNFTGISHMLEHMMFKETKDFKIGEIDKIVNKFGGVQNAFTSNDYTCYYQMWGKNHLEHSLKIESSRMQALLFCEDEFILENKVVQEERKLTIEDSPFSFVFEKFKKLAFDEKNPLHHTVIGEMKDIKNYKLSYLKSFYEKYYSPNNATLIISGNFEEDYVFNKVSKYFENIKSKEIPKKIPYKQSFFKGLKELEISHKNNKVNALFIGFLVPSIHTGNITEVFALIMLSCILTDSKSAILNEKYINQKHLINSINSHYDALSYESQVFIFNILFDENTNFEEFQNIFFADIESLKNKDFNSEDFQEMFNRIKVSFISDDIYYMDDIENQLNFIGSALSIDLDINFSKIYTEEILKIELGDVKKVLKKYFVQENAVILKSPKVG